MISILILGPLSYAFYYQLTKESGVPPTDVINHQLSSPLTVETRPQESTPERSELLIDYCQSPYKVTCATAWQTRDPTGSVASDLNGEVRAFRFMRQIIRQSPDKTSAEIEEELAQKIYTPKRKKRLEDAFVWAKQAVFDILNNQSSEVLSTSEKEMLLARVHEVQLDLPPPATNYADAADLLTKNEIYYERTSSGITRVRVGGAYLINTSSFYNLAFTFAHEISHSIDPCEMARLGPLPNAYQKVLNCFVDQKWTLSNTLQCARSDEISEVFADWVAAQVIARAIEQNSANYTDDEKVLSAINSVRDLCEQPVVGAKPSYHNHKVPRMRIDKVLGSNPELRETLNCIPSEVPPTYCQFDYQENTR